MGIRSVGAALAASALVFGFVLPASAAGVPRDGLVAEYLFDGDAKDTSGNGLHAIARGGVTFVASGEVSLDGSGWLETAADSRLNLGSTATFALRFRQDDATIHGVRLIDRITASSGDGYLVDTYSPSGDGRRIRFIAGSEAVYADASFELGTWHSLVVRFDRGDVRIWVDGSSRGDGSVSVSQLPENNLPLLIGASQGEYGGKEYLSGAIADVRIYSRALSDEEVLGLANDSPIPVAVSVSAAPDPYLSRANKLRAAAASEAIAAAVSRKSRGDAARAKRTAVAFAAAVEARLLQVPDLAQRAFLKAVAANLRVKFR